MNIITSLSFYIFIIAILVNLAFALAVYLSDRISATNRIFITLSISVSVWLVAMYFSLGPNSQNPLAIKLTLFFAVPMNMLFFLFAQTLPSTTLRMSRTWLWACITGTVGVMALTISPLVFRQVAVVNGSLQTTPGIGLIVFGISSILLNLGAIYVSARTFRKAQGLERQQAKLVMIGILLMFGCIVGTIFIPFVLFGNATFVAFFPIYTVLFLGIAGYAIVREGLFNVKVLLTEAAVVILLIILAAQIFTSEMLTERVVGLLVFAGVAFFGIILIDSVHREVRQREELETLNKQIAAQNAQLQDLSHFKSELLSLASHQIRSPLAAIKGFASLISGGSYGEVNDKEKDALKKIQGSADDLIGLINTLLDVRKVEEGKMEYKFERVDIADMAAKVVDLLQPLAAAKQLTLSFEGGHKPVWVSADPEKLKQVVQNLTDNAIKYTPSGFVKVSLQETAPAGGRGGSVSLAVSDSGLGIPTDLIPHLFEEFVRDERVKKEIRGTGLGLYIARKIVEAHGGAIHAESPGEGKGSTFYVTISELAA